MKIGSQTISFDGKGRNWDISVSIENGDGSNSVYLRPSSGPLAIPIEEWPAFRVHIDSMVEAHKACTTSTPEAQQ